MWSRNFTDRLVSWNHLRDQCRCVSGPDALSAINRWWFAYPWVAYSLHWDDRRNWPDPWQLLEENRLCSLARGLGILYTIAMLERQDLGSAQLVETNQDNLVLVDREKYILNWDADTIVNISPSINKNPRHQIDLVEVQQRIS